jgi:hypothetical protein
LQYCHQHCPGYGYDALGNIPNWTQTQASNTVLPVPTWMMTMDGTKSKKRLQLMRNPNRRACGLALHPRRFGKVCGNSAKKSDNTRD